MLAAVEQTIKELDQIQSNLDDLVIDAVKSIEAQVLRLNTIQQLFNGILATGQRIQPDYAASTVRAKIRKGQPTDRVTLRDKGDFYQSLFVEYGKDEFEILSNDFKYQFLAKRYGVEILGLTQESKNQISELIQPIIETEFEKRLSQ